MTVLMAGVVFVGLLTVLNLVFCFGIVRRLREHTTLLDGLSHGGGQPKLIRPAGETVDDFAANTVAGTPVSRASLAGPTLVGFFSLGCGPCEEQLPRFVDVARTHLGGRERVLAVLTGPDEDAAASMLALLAGVAEVVRETDTGPVQQAFGVRGFPAFALVEPGGLLRVSELNIVNLPVPAPA